MKVHSMERTAEEHAVNGSDRSVFSGNETALLLFEAIPSPAFVINTDMIVVGANRIAADIIGPQAKIAYRMKSGALLLCIHNKNHPEGCGKTPFCENCAISISIREALQGNCVSKRKYKLEKVSDEGVSDRYLLISASPLNMSGNTFSLVVLEDVTELSQLRSILPICAKCKKIRDSNDYWESVDTYLRAHENITFTHSLCPDCAQELYPNL